MLYVQVTSPKMDFADPSSETGIRDVEKLHARDVKDLIKRACRERDTLTGGKRVQCCE